MVTLPEKLSREIERVAILRERLYSAAVARRKINPQDDLTTLTPTITAMNQAIEMGHMAAGSGDAESMIAAIVNLRDVKG